MKFPCKSSGEFQLDVLVPYCVQQNGLVKKCILCSDSLTSGCFSDGYPWQLHSHVMLEFRDDSSSWQSSAHNIIHADIVNEASALLRRNQGVPFALRLSIQHYPHCGKMTPLARGHVLVHYTAPLTQSLSLPAPFRDRIRGIF